MEKVEVQSFSTPEPALTTSGSEHGEHHGHFGVREFFRETKQHIIEKHHHNKEKRHERKERVKAYLRERHTRASYIKEPVGVEALDYESLKESLSTGDLILFHGTGDLFSSLIEIKLMSFWSHVAVIVVSPSDRIKQRYHVVKHYEKCAKKGIELSDIDKEIFVFESDICPEEGVDGSTFTPLKQWLLEYEEKYKPMWAVIRKLIVAADDESSLSKDEEEERRKVVADQLERFMYECGDLIYERDLSQLFLCSFKKNKTEDLKYIFCSELVAAFYKKMGILEGNSSNFLPVDFCPPVLPLHGGASLGAMNRMVLNSALYPTLQMSKCTIPKTLISVSKELPTRPFSLMIHNAVLENEKVISELLFSKLLVSSEGVSEQKGLQFLPSYISVSLCAAMKHSARITTAKVGLFPEWNEKIELSYYSAYAEDLEKPFLRFDIMSITTKAPFPTGSVLGTNTLTLQDVINRLKPNQQNKPLPSALQEAALHSPTNANKLFATLKYEFIEFSFM